MNYQSGRVYVVEFWATWCPPCIKVIAHLSKIQQQHATSLTVVAVNADGLLGFSGRTEKVREFMKKHGKDMRYTVAMEDLANKTMSNAWITASRAHVPAGMYVTTTQCSWSAGGPAKLTRTTAFVY